MPQSLEHSDKQHLLDLVVGLASDAAATAFLARKGPSLALEFLELGRGVIAASLEELRTDILGLREKYPELAEQYERLQIDLESPGSHNLSFMSEQQQSWQGQANQRYKVGNMFDELIVEIRKEAMVSGLLAGTNDDDGDFHFIEHFPV